MFSSALLLIWPMVTLTICTYSILICILYHDIYHLSKPKKIRVVFECNAQFNGRSISKELQSGHDLTNQLVSVLIKFRQEQVAVIGYIESMFYMVWVSEEHRSLLRLPWRKDGDLNDPPVDHEMGRHIHSDVSSPSCGNYAVKKTADDNT